ncbi:MAG: MogA/MoaB family molybdenum cofactor biosynthesis protein [Tissierellia bacterium]|jgi:molybdopterin adenylyltransferase|nr:MogA/MoaB family molybdenum cofactor biosynthesis protein [Tissierellia bacterium]
MYTVGIITASDKGSKGQREDLSGKAIKDIVASKGYKLLRQVIVPDEEDELIKEMKYMADELKIDLILTTGGTGFSKRDVTPEASMKVFTRQAPGIAEAIRYYSLSITPRAMLSRAVSGIRNDTLIINLPGSPKAVKEALEYAIDSIEHGLGILTGKENECAR